MWRSWRADYTQSVKELQERASFDSSTVEQQKRTIEQDKEAVIESIQQMDEECRALDAQTADVRVQIVGVADKLNDCVTNRDERLPQSECAACDAGLREELPASSAFVAAPRLAVLVVCCCASDTPVAAAARLCRLKINLYKMGTSLEWDFNTDMVKGYVIKADKQELRPFEIDPACKSRVQLADELWSTMS